MFRVVFSCALVAVISAEGHSGEPTRDFKSYAYTSAFNIKDRVDSVQEDCMPKSDLAQQLKDLTDDLTAAGTSVTNTLANANEELGETITESLAEVKNTVDEISKHFDEEFNHLEEALTATAEALESSIDSTIANLTETVASALTNYETAQQMANSTGDHRWERNYALVQVAQAGANTENGHAGRMMYKVMYNPNNPGYFHPGGPELKSACSELSKDLKKVDGIDRALKPAADVDWASDGDSVRLQGSYLSNCGCGGHPRQRQCVGMSNNFLRGGVMYNRYNSWWGCKYLRHDGRDCHHHWSNCYGNWGVKGIYTVCTSSNDQYKV